MKPQRPRLPKGIKPIGTGQKGRPVGYKPIYSTEQITKYKSQALRYGKATELANVGPDAAIVSDKIILTDDRLQQLRGKGSELFADPYERYDFYYLAKRSPDGWWRVRFRPITPPDPDPESPYLPIALDRMPTRLPAWTTGRRLQIYAETDFGGGELSGGADAIQAELYISRVTNRTSNNQGFYAQALSSGYATEINTFGTWPVPWLNAVPTNFLPSGYTGTVSFSIDSGLRDANGWEIMFADYSGWANQATLIGNPAGTLGPFYNRPFGYSLAFGWSDFPPPASFSDYVPGGRNFVWELIYDRAPINTNTGDGGSSGGGSSGSGGQGGIDPNAEWLCDCPDFTRTLAANVESLWVSEAGDRDWSLSDAGCDQLSGCKHIMSTKLWLGLEVPAPTDYPL